MQQMGVWINTRYVKVQDVGSESFCLHRIIVLFAHGHAHPFFSTPAFVETICRESLSVETVNSGSADFTSAQLYNTLPLQLCKLVHMLWLAPERRQM